MSPRVFFDIRPSSTLGGTAAVVADAMARWPDDFPAGEPPVFGPKRNTGPLRLDHAPPCFLVDHDFHEWRGSRCDCLEMAVFLAKVIASWPTGYCDICGDEVWGEGESYCGAHYRSEVINNGDD
jgi:hypothetical protein